MEDIISTLHDSILCHILSFLPTKVVVATSLVSKRWKPLWRSVPALDFTFYGLRKATFDCFIESLWTFLLSRELDQPLRRVFLRCTYHHVDVTALNACLSAVAQRRVQHLFLQLFPVLPSAVLSCKTLVFLHLGMLHVGAISSVDFPSLKILHLIIVQFSELAHLANLLSGTPNLEVLECEDLYISNFLIEANFERLSKLVRAKFTELHVPLQVVNNVEFLHMYPLLKLLKVDRRYLIPGFHNLTHIEFGYFFGAEDWIVVVELLKHCPKLQTLFIYMHDPCYISEQSEAVWSYPECVPTCILLHLTTCCLKNYSGTKGEFLFAKYIMLNAAFLRTMVISKNSYLDGDEWLEMFKELCLCPRGSTTCELLFE